MSAAAREWKSVVSSGVLGEYSQDGLTQSMNAFSVTGAGGAADTPQPSGSAAAAASTTQRPKEKRAWASLFSPAGNKTAAGGGGGAAVATFAGHSLATPTAAAASADKLLLGSDAHIDKRSRMGDGPGSSIFSPDFDAAANLVFEEAAARADEAGAATTAAAAAAPALPAVSEEEEPASPATTTAAPAAPAAAPAAAAAPALTAQQIGEQLYPLVVAQLSADAAAQAQAGKVTGMLLDGIETPALLALLTDGTALTVKVAEALTVLNEAGVLPAAATAAVAAAAAAATAAPASPGGTPAAAVVPFEPLNERKIQQRQRQVELGQMTEGYKNYCKVVDASRPVRGDPQTPDPRKPCSKRSFDGMCIKWRRELHKFDEWAKCEAMIKERKKLRRSPHGAALGGRRRDSRGNKAGGARARTPGKKKTRKPAAGAHAPAQMRRSQSMSRGAASAPTTPVPLLLKRSSSAPNTPAAAAFVLEQDFPELSPRT